MAAGQTRAAHTKHLKSPSSQRCSPENYSELFWKSLSYLSFPSASARSGPSCPADRTDILSYLGNNSGAALFWNKVALVRISALLIVLLRCSCAFGGRPRQQALGVVQSATTPGLQQTRSFSNSARALLTASPSRL